MTALSDFREYRYRVGKAIHDLGGHKGLADDLGPLGDVIEHALDTTPATGTEGLPHPGENHEFRTTCLRCGERGMLNVSLITDSEVVTISDRAALGTLRCGCTADTELAMASGCAVCGHRDHGASGCRVILGAPR